MREIKNKKKKKKKINTNKLILVLVMALMFTVGLGVFLKSNVFEMKEVKIEGNKELKEEDIIQKLNIVQNKNIFSYDTKAIKEKVLESPYIEDAKVKLKLPKTIIVSIDEIVPAALLKDENKYCYISKKGEKIEDIKDLKENSNKIVVDIDFIDKENKIEFENDESKKMLLYLLDCISIQNINKEICEIDFRDKETISLTTQDNIKVVVPNDDELDYNVSRLSKILIDLKSKNKSNGTVDLTYGNYALYSPN